MASLAGGDGDQASGDAALAGEAADDNPVSGGLFEVGGGHQSQVVAADLQRALTRVELAAGLRLEADAALLLQQVGDAQVAAIRCQLRRIHRLIQLQRTASKPRKAVLDEAPCLRLAVSRHQAGTPTPK